MTALDPSSYPYTIYARNEQLQRVAQLDSFSELELHDDFNDVGSWTMTIPADANGAQFLTEVGARRGVIVEDDSGNVVFSGPLTVVERRGDGQGDVLELSGVSDNALIARRVARPDPAGPPYATDADVRSGLADQVIAEYVDAAMGQAAELTYGRPERREAGLVIPGTSGIGDAITAWSAKFDNLLEMLQSIAAAGGGIGFRLRQRTVAAAQLEFVGTRPVDKTASLVFDPDVGSLSSRTRTESAPSATYVIGAGGGEGTQRLISERGAADAVVRYGLREVFQAGQGTDEPGVLGQQIDATLAQSRESISVEVQAVDTDQVRYGRDYGLGDQVTCRVTYLVTVPDGTGGVTVDERVEETVGYVASIKLTISEATIADNGIGMITPTIQTLGTITSSGGQIAGRGGGLAGYLARNLESETPGIVKQWARAISEIPARYQLMDGSAGTTDMRGRAAVGADGNAGSGSPYALFSTGGAASAGVTLAHHHTGAAHTHVGHHSHTIPAHLHPIPDHGHTIPSHTHTAADHSHSVATHTHTAADHSHTIPNHNHTTDINHDHPNQAGAAAASPDLANTIAAGAGAVTSVNPYGHVHPVNLAALGSLPTASGNQSSGGSATNDKTGFVTDTNTTPTVTGDKTGFVTNTNTLALATDNKTGASTSNNTASGLATDNDTATAPAATFTGNTGDALTDTTIATISPYKALLFIQRIAA